MVAEQGARRPLPAWRARARGSGVCVGGGARGGRSKSRSPPRPALHPSLTSSTLVSISKSLLSLLTFSAIFAVLFSLRAAMSKASDFTASTWDEGERKRRA